MDEILLVSITFYQRWQQIQEEENRLRKAAVQKSSDNKVYDPNENSTELTWDRPQPRSRQWHMGHKPGQEYSTLFAKYLSGEITKGEFLKEYRNSDNYHPEDPSENESHKHEQIPPGRK